MNARSVGQHAQLPYRSVPVPVPATCTPLRAVFTAGQTAGVAMDSHSGVAGHLSAGERRLRAIRSASDQRELAPVQLAAMVAEREPNCKADARVRLADHATPQPETRPRGVLGAAVRGAEQPSGASALARELHVQAVADVQLSHVRAHEATWRRSLAGATSTADRRAAAMRRHALERECLRARL